MSMPKIADINPIININREDAINIIIASIAMEELSIAHILNAEGEKLQFVLGTLDNKNPGDITFCDIMAVNQSIRKTMRDVIKTEMLLQLKLEDAVELAENEDECRLTISGRKIWRDGNNVEGTRPASVVISLLRDNVAVDRAIVDSMGDGRFSFACLPVSSISGHRYVYRIDETEVPNGYTKTLDGFNVINTVEPGARTIEGLKIWGDNNVTAGRPTNVTVNLLRNGKQFNSTTFASGTGAQVPFSFSNVPKFDNMGNLFVYTVDETEVPGYRKTIDGFNITNTLAP